MADAREPSNEIDRRRLLRGGAIVAGAAGAAALGAVAGAPNAEAANGNNVVLGTTNAETSATTIAISAGAAPALTLSNTNGPQLRLGTVPDTYAGGIALGDVINTVQGPVVGVADGSGAKAAILVTPDDLFSLVPFTFAIDPDRILDTRTAAGRTAIVRKSSTTALTSAGKLKAGQWIDVSLDKANSVYEPLGFYFNATAVAPTGSGYLSVYTPDGGAKPDTSTINFRAGVTIANGGLVAATAYNDYFVVRIYTSAETFVLLDQTGATIVGIDGGDAVLSARRKVIREAQRKQLAQVQRIRAARRRN